MLQNNPLKTASYSLALDPRTWQVCALLGVFGKLPKESTPCGLDAQVFALQQGLQGEEMIVKLKLTVACARACVRACMHAFVRMFVCVCECVCVCVACVCV